MRAINRGAAHAGMRWERRLRTGKGHRVMVVLRLLLNRRQAIWWLTCAQTILLPALCRRGQNLVGPTLVRRVIKQGADVMHE